MANGSVNPEDAARARRQARFNKALETASKLQDNLGLNGANGGENGKGEWQTSIDLVVKGVTINWLAQAFNMDHRTCTHRLKECPALKRPQGGGRGTIYDLATAAQYLVTPKFNVEEYLRTMRIEDLPTRLQEGFWAAALKRQKWEENAGRLWRTERVVKLFSETFLLIANDMKMWLDDMEAVTEVTAEQRAALEKQLAILQTKVTKRVRELPRVTPSQAHELAQTPAPVEKEEPNDIDADILAVV